MIDNFDIFVQAIQNQFDKMVKGDRPLFKIEIDRDEIWEKYLASFPEGTDPIYKERTEHNCNACKSFIRQFGTIVSIDPSNYQTQTIWDINIDNFYQDVANAMSDYIKSRNITNFFLHHEKQLGVVKNHQKLENGDITTWRHLNLTLPKKYIYKNVDQIGSLLSERKANKEVLKRALDEITDDSVEVVLDLIAQSSLYRGGMFQKTVKNFKLIKSDYSKLEDWQKDNFCWLKSFLLGSASKIRNSVIGTLLVDLSNGVDLEKAVRSYESKTAPTNYKRPTALITKSMVNNAKKKLQELGLLDSLQRRHAVISDVSINDVLFADRGVQPAMKDIFDELSESIPTKHKMKNLEEVHIEKFISDILPNIQRMDLYVENHHENNFISILTAQNDDCPYLFTWDNHFSWSYNGNVTDSIKEKVKKAGGQVDGVLRCSLSWFNTDDLDIHVIEPDGSEIYYNIPRSKRSGGRLDVDMNARGPYTTDAVENITWGDINKMLSGEYTVFVHNFTKRNNEDFGFVVEIECCNNIERYCYNKILANNEKIDVVKFNFDPKTREFKILESLKTEKMPGKNIWNITTNNFIRCQAMMLSPNHWGGQSIGHKHYIFILENCKNPHPVRGFYNEFLKPQLMEHRKVFEVLASRMKVQPEDNQLSGIGFSESTRNSIICKCEGSFERPIKLKF